MVIPGRINKVAFYCRVNHRDRDYEKYLDAIVKKLRETYGEQEWDMKIFFEEASGADSERMEFNRLKTEISLKEIHVVISVRAMMIARDWGQFMSFMKICEENRVEVLCLDEVEDATKIYKRIEAFKKNYFEGSDVSCR